LADRAQPAADTTAAAPTTKPAAEPDLTELQQGLTTLIMKVYFYTRRVFDEAMRQHGISGSQAGVLNRIYEQPGISGVEISRQMLTTPQSVQPMLAVLESQGLIERRPNPSRGRVIEAHLTELGRSVVLRCRADVPATERQLGKRLTAQERQTLVELLERYLDGED
jgi:DNA-binding MarR family transcriptional regulator